MQARFSEEHEQKYVPLISQLDPSYLEDEGNVKKLKTAFAEHQLCDLILEDKAVEEAFLKVDPSKLPKMVHWTEAYSLFPLFLFVKGKSEEEVEKILGDDFQASVMDFSRNYFGGQFIHPPKLAAKINGMERNKNS